MYVDNSGNANTFKIRMDGELGVYIVPAGCGAHLPCYGVKTLDFEGEGQAYIRLSNVAIPPTAVNAAQQVTFPAPQPVTLSGTPNVNSTIVGSLANVDETFALGVAVAAGATLNIGNVNTANSRRFNFVAYESSNAVVNNLKVGYRYNTTTGISLSPAAIFGAPITNPTAYINADTLSPNTFFYLNNGDTVNHSFDCFVYLFAN